MCTYLDKVGSTYYFRRPVPKDLRGHFKTISGATRTEWKISLGVKDREEAKRLLPIYVARSNDEIADARRGVRQAQPANTGTEADSIEYRQAIDERDLASMEWAELASAHWDEQEARAEADPMFAAELALRGAAARLEREREEIVFARELARERKVAASVGVMELFERYAAQPGRNAKTVAQWRPYLEKLVAFTGIADASHLTSDHIRKWRNHLRDHATYKGRRLSDKTINGSYLAAASVVFRWALDDGLIAADPTAGVKPVKRPLRPLERSRDMQEEEARVVLCATLRGPDGREGKAFTNAKRWIPWILCYTGARVNEITQLRKQDVSVIEGVNCITITPEAGAVKNKTVRTIPIHSDLLAQGFLDFVSSQPDGPLFYDPSKRWSENALNRQANRLGSKLAEWVRSLGVNPPQPNHAWRHRFITLAQRHELSERAARAIVGHTPGDQHRRYGNGELPVLLRELEKIPPFAL